MDRKEKIAKIREGLLKNQYPLEFKNYAYSQENCYAYALGSDFKEDPNDSDYIFNIGAISGKEQYPRTYAEAEEAFMDDMKVLGIECRKCDMYEEVKNGEWKVLLFFDLLYANLYDFHFIREDRDGLWSHKQGIQGGVWRFGGDPEMKTDLTFVGSYILKLLK